MRQIGFVLILFPVHKQSELSARKSLNYRRTYDCTDY